jgi:hypothetical protein
VEDRLKAVCKQRDVLVKKEECAWIFKYAVRVPGSVTNAAWDHFSEDVDLEALFRPWYPREPWPKEVPYLNMVGLLHFCQAKKEAAEVEANEADGNMEQ